MEIEIKEKINTLEITKNCKQELRKMTNVIISIMILICFIYIYYNPSMFLLFPIYVTPLAYIIFTIVCQRYKYEVIFIDTKQIIFSSSYTEKNSKTSMTSFFKIENLKECLTNLDYETIKNLIKNSKNYILKYLQNGCENTIALTVASGYIINSSVNVIPYLSGFNKLNSFLWSLKSGQAG